MAHSKRLTGFLAILLLTSIVAVQVHADAGATVLGAGFSGKPFVLEGDVVVETLGIYESIRDYEDASNPTWIGWFDHQLAGIWRELIHDNGLVVALRDTVRPGLEIVDMTDPSSPQALATMEGTNYTSAWLRDNTLIMSTDSYLLTYDLSDPTEPTFADFQIVGERARSRWFSDLGNLLYFVDHGATLRVFDLSDPLHPFDLGTVALTSDRIDAMVMGNGVLYIVTATSDDQGRDQLDLVTLDLTVPLAPQEVDRRLLSGNTGTTGLQLMRADRLLIVATSDPYLQAFDLGDPAHPAAGYTLPLQADHLTISASQVFVMTGQDVQIYPRTDAAVPPGEPVIRSLLPRLRTVAGRGPLQFAQLHAERSVLLPVDARNPRHPLLGEPFDTGLDGEFLLQDDLGLMLNSYGAFQLVDLSNHFQPLLLGAVDNPRCFFFAAELARDYAVIETGSVVVELRFYDLSDPQNPYVRAIVYDYGLKSLDGDLMICTRSNHVRIYDVSDPWQAHLLRQIEVPGIIREVQLHQDHAYVLTESLSGDRSIQVVRLTNPAYPELIAEIPLSHIAYRLYAHVGRLYAVGYHLGQIIDVADPAIPEVVAEFPAWGQTGTGLAFNGDVTTVGGWLITVRDNGLAHAAVPGPALAAVSRLEPPFPNPLNPGTTFAFTNDRARHLTLTVHDVRGRRVAELATGTFSAGRHLIEWNGRDAAGHSVASGVYLVRLHGDDVDASRRLAVVK